MSRYNNFGHSYYENNAKLGSSAISKTIGYSKNFASEDPNFEELQYMLESQRKKFKEAKQKFQHDLDNQRRHRIEFQQRMIKLKDQFSKKQLTISQLEFNMNNLLHQNQDVVLENERLRSQLARLQDLYGGKIRELQSHLNLQSRTFQETTVQYNTQFEKFRKEGQDYIEQLNFEFERKTKNLEERAKNAQKAKMDLILENKKLNDILMNNKLSFEQEMREMKNRARDQQAKKSQYMLKGFQQKIKNLEDTKEILLRKNQQLLRTVGQRDRQIQDLTLQASEEVIKYRQDYSDQHQPIAYLNNLVTKLKSELAEKDLLLSKVGSDTDNKSQSLRQQLELKKQQNIALSATIRDLRETLKQSQNDWERRRRELTERTNIMESQARKYKQEYMRICQVLKSSINDTINNVSHKKQMR